MELPATELRKLKPGSQFRRPEGTHRYLVSNERLESCGNVQIYCHNLTNGNAYFWSDHARVVPIVPDVPIYAEDHCCPTSRAGQSHPFWMCVVENGGPPTMKHLHQGLARDEAERLAKKTGRPVYLLEAVGKVSLEYVPTVKKPVWGPVLAREV